MNQPTLTAIADENELKPGEMKKITVGDKNLLLANADNELFIVDDKDGTPTYTHDFAKNVKLLIEKEYWGLYNLVCGGQTSRFEVAEELIKLLNFYTKV